MNSNNYEKSIVKITVQQLEIDLNHPLNLFSKNESTGTGFYIDSKLILTCHHVVENALDIIVDVYKNELDKIKIKAKIKYIFPDDDLAIIELAEPNTNYIKLNFDMITKNDNVEVNTIGYPLDTNNIKINRGIISGFQDSMIQTDSTLNPGNSGGPLIINNKVIGINQSKYVEASNTGFAIPIFRFLIFWLLKPEKLKFINKKPKLLFDYQEIKQGYTKFNLPDDINYGVIITKISDLSLLNKYNIRVGDLLLKVNNNKINNYGDIKFNFYPEKINLHEINLWFIEDDELEITYYSNNTKTIKTEKIILKYINTQLIDYYYDSNEQPYYYNNQGLLFSIFTNYHLNNFTHLNLKINQKVKLLSRFGNCNYKFTVYLADIDYKILNFTEYPIGEIITEIDDVVIDNLYTFTNIMKNNIKKFKTIDNQIFFI